MDDNFVKLHEAQLSHLDFPTLLYSELQEKITNNIFDGALKFGISEYESGERCCVVVSEDGAQAREGVYLVDHFFSFPDSDLALLRQTVCSFPEPLLDRLGAMVGVPRDDTISAISRNADKWRRHRIVESMWKYLCPYNPNGQWMWYIMDELGSSISHSADPNVVCAPFLHITVSPDGQPSFTPYTILWVTRDLECGDLLERDFVSWLSTPIERMARLSDWVEEEIDDDCIDQLMTSAAHYASIVSELSKSGGLECVCSDVMQIDKTISEAEFMARRQPTLPSLLSTPTGDGSAPLKVWTSPEDPLRLRHSTGGLTHPAFILLDTAEDNTANAPAAADIVWHYNPIKTTNAWTGTDVTNDHHTSVGKTPLQIVNQFPYEGCFLQKDHLAREISRCIGLPSWWHPTFDLEISFPIFAGEFLRRRLVNEGDKSVTVHMSMSKGIQPMSVDRNVWIVKPSIGARSMGHIITNSLLHIARVLETEPRRVAQKYIERPLLCRENKKFDLRFVVCLRRCNPVELYIYNTFWPRIANKATDVTAWSHSSTDHPDNCTNMNFCPWENKEASLTAMYLLEEGGQQEPLPDCERFVRELMEMYPGLVGGWVGVMKQVRQLFRELFLGVTMGQPSGMQCEKARAVYGCDVMLEVSQVDTTTGAVTAVQPKLLEVTFSPSNLAVCPHFEKTYPSYVNDVFGCLFLGESDNMTRIL